MINKLIGLSITGISLGWVVGLSTTPVVQTVLTGLLTLIVTIISVVSGLSNPTVPNPANSTFVKVLNEVKTVSVYPLAIFTLSIALGSSAGLYTRSNNLLGLNPTKSMEKWTGTKYTPLEIRTRMFDLVYPAASPGGAAVSAREAGLYSVSASDYALLEGFHGEPLRTRLKALNDTTIAKLADACKDDNCLEKLKVSICPQK